MKFNILDLFCGAGGFSSGIEKNENFKVKIASDINPICLKTFKKNIKIDEKNLILGDISNQKIQKKIIELSLKKKINMIIGGPPCQGYSNKGKKLGVKDKRNFLFLDYFKILEKIKPFLFIIENVKALKNKNNEIFFNQIIDKAKNLNYNVYNSILNAKDFGIPQNRKRIIIIGIKNTSKIYFDFDIIKKYYSKEKITVKDAIFDLNYLNSGEGKNISNYKNKPSSNFQKLMRVNSQILYNHVATNHKKITLKKLGYIFENGTKKSLPKNLLGKQKFSTTWSRLNWNEISPTIDTRFDTPSNGKNSHPIIDRSITPREAARLQSFPDNFIFLGNKSEIRTQIGNAVPPILSEKIGLFLNDIFSNDDFETNKKKYKLYFDDAFNIIKKFKKNNLIVDHIITDPPYKISKKNNFHTMKNPRNGIDFGKWDKNFNLFKWIKDYSTILNKNGSFIIFCSYLYLSLIIIELEKNGLVVKDVLKWRKNNPMPRNIKRRYVQDVEYAIWSVKKGAKWIFNKPNNVAYLRAEFCTNIVSKKNRWKHPNSKHLELMEQIIKIHTNENQTILDPFMGSGTTGISCIKNNRKFIGIENNSIYFKNSLLRFQKFKKY